MTKRATAKVGPGLASGLNCAAMLLLLSTLSACAMHTWKPVDHPADIVWTVKGEFCEPETVLPLPDQTLLVSNVCDFRTSGDGFLSLLDAKGKVLHWRVLNDLDSPLGMALSGGQLYVIDNNSVKVFGWPGFTPVRTIKLQTRVANDIAIAEDGSLYISDTGAHEVLQVSSDGTQSVLDSPISFKNANGIAVHDGHLFVGGERLWRIDLNDGTHTVVGPEWLSDIDGIEFEADGRLQITSVGGALIRYNEHGRSEQLSGPGVSSANHGYSATLGLALIPTGYDNTVIAIRVRPDTASRP